MRIAILGAFLALSLSAQTISVSQLGLWDDPSEKTLGQLWSAAAQNPKSAAARANISYALLSENRLQQAEWAAREAVQIDPSNARGQLILGWTLAREYRYTAEALDCLRRAAPALPLAHLGAADVLAHQGSLAEARAEVEAYLATGATDYRVPAQSWLKRLSN
jgi:predicted Zn-dependent protease